MIAIRHLCLWEYKVTTGFSGILSFVLMVFSDSQNIMTPMINAGLVSPFMNAKVKFIGVNTFSETAWLSKSDLKLVYFLKQNGMDRKK